MKTDKKIIINDELILKSLDSFFFCIQQDINNRYKSWEHCYSVFKKYENKSDDNTIDLLCLNLAFYLASWGMYRGSSFLLHKDYKIHEKAIRFMQQKEFNSLRGIDIDNLQKDEEKEKIKKLQIKLTDIYTDIKKTVPGFPNKKVSDTLITKILMGVFGCVPAYDRFLKDTIKHSDAGIGTANFSTSNKIPERIDGMINFYKKHFDILENKRNEVNNQNKEVTYPQMKILDALLWQIGYDLSDKREDTSEI